MIVHRLSDLVAVGSQARGLAQGLLGDTATRILYNEHYDEATAARRIPGLAEVEAEQLPELLARRRTMANRGSGPSSCATSAPPPNSSCSTPTPGWTANWTGFRTMGPADTGDGGSRRLGRGAFASRPFSPRAVRAAK
jgi:hypothetical protein